jgi:outer membrane protein
MKSYLLLFLTVFSIGASAQVKKMSLAECVEYALENNITVAQFELDLESAELGNLDALGQFLPRLNGSLSVNESKGLILDPQTQTNVAGNILSGSISTYIGLYHF